MGGLPVYGFCFIFTACLVLMFSLSTEYIITYVNDILIPCQHDSVWDNSKCVCDNTNGVFGGQYCEQCQCKHNGLCAIYSKKKSTSSRWSCRCPSSQKWAGTLCDKCYAEESTDDHCRGTCITAPYPHYGARCETVCMQYDNMMNTHCQEVIAGGGTCNACNNHGTCTDSGACDCDPGYYTSRGGEQCAMSCDSAGFKCNHGTCQTFGNELQCICNTGWFGPKCDQTCSDTPNSKPCSNNGVCAYNAQNQLLCTCNVFFRGKYCNYRCPGDTSVGEPCSGHGTCALEGTAAVCNCQDDWSGLDCGCSAKYTCSGHGVCLHDTSTCQCFEEETYKWAGDTCAHCAPNWYGSHCHLFCDRSQKYTSNPLTNGKQIGCNNQGSCSLVSKNRVEHVTCVCENTDPDTFCATCMAGKYPDIRLQHMSVPACSVDCNPGICSYHGICNRLYNGDNDLCQCNPVFKNGRNMSTIDPAQYCSTCRPNWYPNSMSSPNHCSFYCAADGFISLEPEQIVFTPDSAPNYNLKDDKDAQHICVNTNGTFMVDSEFSPDPDCHVCSGAGMCQPDGKCQCNEGVTGNFCEIDCLISVVNGKEVACSNHGRCVRNTLELWFNSKTASSRCECKPYDEYTSATRERLLKKNFQVPPPPIPEYYGEHCEYHCPRYNGAICANRGTCHYRNSVNNVGRLESCTNDANCTDEPGEARFCAPSSTPWDTLAGVGASFFAVDKPGYSLCSYDTACADSISSIDYDQFCVSMLSGWFPKELNTAQCTFESDQCQTAVEDFFTKPYNGNQSWCTAVLDTLSPDLDICLNHVQPNQHQQLDSLCQSYTTDFTCSANHECVYDESYAYINRTDAACAANNDVNDCWGACQPSDNNTCITKTYCRAKNCRDIVFENPLETFCFSADACPNSPNSHTVDWTKRCSTLTGRLIADNTTLPVRQVFFSCLMYQQSSSPLDISTFIPGNIDIPGNVTFLNKNVSIAEFRRSVLDSRVEGRAGPCTDELRHLDSTSFCQQHLQYILPDWYQTQTTSTYTHLVYCNGRIDTLWDSWNKANNRLRVLTISTGFNCEIMTQDLANPWILRCLGHEDRPVPSFDVKLYPDAWTACEFVPRRQVLQWSHQPLEDYDVVKTFHAECQEGLQGPWAQKSSPTPSLCDLGACHPDDSCHLCSEPDSACDQYADVFCKSQFSTDCEHNRCQRGGNCHQGNFQSFNGYMCDYVQNQTLTVVDTVGAGHTAILNHRGVMVLQTTSDDYPTQFQLWDNDTIINVVDWYSVPSGIAFKPSAFKSVPLNPLNLVKDLPLQNRTTQTDQCYNVASNFNWYQYCHLQDGGHEVTTAVGTGLLPSWTTTGTVEGGPSTVVLRHPSSIQLQLSSVTISWKRDRETAVKLTYGNNELEIYGHGIAISKNVGHTLNVTNHLNGVYLTQSTQYYHAQVSCQNCQFQVSTLYGSTSLVGLVLRNKTQLTTLTQTYAVDGRTIANLNSTLFVNGVLQLSGAEATSENGCELTMNGSVNCTGRIFSTKGIRWNLQRNPDATRATSWAKRISGWAKISATEKELAHVELSDTANNPIVNMYVLQHTIYINGQKTNCSVVSQTWWSWELDVRYLSPTSTWSIQGSVNNCRFESVRKGSLSSLERAHPQRIAASFLDIPERTASQCRRACVHHPDCVQWSQQDRHCFLYKKRCHEDVDCVPGTHTLYAARVASLQYLDIFNVATHTESWWTKLYEEPLLPVPLSIQQSCAPLPTSQRWKSAWAQVYKPYTPDATSLCRGLKQHWRLLPTVLNRDSGNDLQFCANNTAYFAPSTTVKPDVCPSDVWSQYQGLNWTAYCKYQQSFIQLGKDAHGLKKGDIPFLGSLGDGEQQNMSTLCATTFEIRKEDTVKCHTPVSNAWYETCLSQTALYETHCSDQCVAHIQDLLATTPESPGLCSRRQQFLDMRVTANQKTTSVQEHCTNCNISKVVLTDFCWLRDIYHDGDRVNIPELANSKCTGHCRSLLSNSFNRSDWRNWCHKLAHHEISGVCSTTTCKCNTEEFLGVAGELCEVTCPTGSAEGGQELACSGRNGHCFAKTALSVDNTQHTSPLDEYRLQNIENQTTPTKLWLPLWQRGPEPTVQGVCQCSLGSGLTCAIPCDKCNNGTYGDLLSSQYGICDAFAGICRALPSFTRLNIKLKDISYNSTSFESGKGVSKWEHPEHFLYESDQTVLKQCLLYLWDKTGEDYNMRPYATVNSERMLVSETKTLSETLWLFRQICWDNTGNLKYLSNEKKVTLQGVSFSNLTTVDKRLRWLNTFQTTDITNCRQIPMYHRNSIKEWYMCYDNGRLTAYDLQQGPRTSTYDGTSLYVVYDQAIPTTGATFARGDPDSEDREAVYMFGGQSEPFPMNFVQYNSVYRISFRHIDWHPISVVHLQFSRMATIGNPPPPQMDAPLWAFASELYVLSTSTPAACMYKLTLPTTEKPRAEWYKGACQSLNGAFKSMWGSNSELYIYTDHDWWTYANKSWSLNAPTISSDVFQIEDKTYNIKGAQFDCNWNVTTDYVALNNRKLVTFENTIDTLSDITVYAEDLVTVNTVDVIRRVHSAVSRTNSEGLLRKPTYDELTKAFLLLKRVYMLQARWTAPDMLSRFYALQATTPYTVITKLPTVSVGPSENMIEFVRNINLGTLFSGSLRYEPQRITVATAGTTSNGQLFLYATTTTNYNNYLLKLHLSNGILEFLITWTPKVFKLTIQRPDSSGSLQWTSSQLINTWSLVIHLNKWLKTDEMFEVFVSPELYPTYSVDQRLAQTLGYSGSHCSPDSSVRCPGFLPHVSLPCSGHGRCNRQCQCSCEPTPSELAIDKNTYEADDSAWRGDGCQFTCPGFDGYNKSSICNGQGTCGNDGKCMCSQGRIGDACQFQCPGFENDDITTICTNHGACGTTGYEGASFRPSSNSYDNTIISTNAQNFRNAMLSFYDQCRYQNYPKGTGTFSNIAYRDLLHASSQKSEVIDSCERINYNLRFQDYQTGRCLGLQEINNIHTGDKLMYVPMRLNQITNISVSDYSLHAFVCNVENCELQRSKLDDQSIANIQHHLRETSFEFDMRYVHGHSSGRILYVVNKHIFFMDIFWNETHWHFDGNQEFQVTKTGAWERVVLTITGTIRTLTFYPVLQPETSQEVLYMAPNFHRNYIPMNIQHKAYYYPISADTGKVQVLTYLQNASRLCDLDNNCTGIIRWTNASHDGSFFALSHELVTQTTKASAYFYQKASYVYKGRHHAHEHCAIIDATRSKFPPVTYTEVYDLPLQTTSLGNIRDHDFDNVDNGEIVVNVGSGVWEYCWKQQKVASKIACYEAAKRKDCFGFAWGNGQCLIYTGMTTGKKIQLEKWSTMAGKTKFNPCISKKTTWKTLTKT